MRHVLFTASLLMLAACQGQSGGETRDQIRAVGSSTVYPFSQEAVRLFQLANPGMKAPIIESTGTGAGISLFCRGVGAQNPDIANASRRMKKSEFEQCQANGVNEIIEVQIGLDGLAVAESIDGPKLQLTTKQIYEALAANPYGKGPNTAKTWQDIDPSLPAIAISVFGPPSTSGTRDSLAELILTPGCESDPAMKELKENDEAKHKQLCTQVREDGIYVDAGENDNLIVQKLVANPDAVGIFGFSFLDANRNAVRDIPVNGVGATYETVSSGEYPGARPIYVYVKKAHITAIPGLKGYMEAFSNNWAPDGALARRGMVASPEGVRTANADAIANLSVLNGDELR